MDCTPTNEDQAAKEWRTTGSAKNINRVLTGLTRSCLTTILAMKLKMKPNVKIAWDTKILSGKELVLKKDPNL